MNVNLVLGMGLAYQNGLTFYNAGAPAPGTPIAPPTDPATIYQAAGVFGWYHFIQNGWEVWKIFNILKIRKFEKFGKFRKFGKFGKFENFR